MQQPRNPLTYLIIGSGLGLVLGAVVGIAIGGSGRSPGPVRVETVVSTRTVNAGLAAATTPTRDTPPPPLTSTTDITPTDTFPTTDTTATDTTGLDTTATDTTATDTTATDTTAAPPAPNDVPPPDPNNPPRGFCSTHVCAPGFSKGHGYVVQCADGVWTMQGGEARACGKDGGLA